MIVVFVGQCDIDTCWGFLKDNKYESVIYKFEIRQLLKIHQHDLNILKHSVKHIYLY